MIYAVFLRVICLCCTCYLTAGFVASFFFDVTDVIPYMLGLVAAGTLTIIAKRYGDYRKERIASLTLLIPPVIAAVMMWGDVLRVVGALMVLLPTTIVLFVWAWQDNMLPSYEQHRRFSLRIAALLIMLAVLSGIGAGAEQYDIDAIPYFVAVIFLTCSVILLRCLRHDESTLTKPRFALTNSFIVLALTALALPFGFRGVRSAISAGFRAIGLWLRPLFYLENPPELVNTSTPAPTFTPEPSFEPFGTFQSPTPSPMPATDPPVYIGEGVATPTWFFVLIALAAVAALTVMMLLIGAKHKKTQNENEAEQAKIKPQRGEKRRHESNEYTAMPVMLVRGSFRRLMTFLARERMPVSIALTSADVKSYALRLGCDESDISRLRELYLRARYSKNGVSLREAALSASLVASIKKRIRNTISEQTCEHE